ncbi:hypothetical protein EHW97_11830 [Aeromicrobium camelliae]|uniref:Uncharacterized protein n=1 Tax=Aeromicrobium camelliae TaxID=1538144 RepID=A0A3N6WNH3_9ACTN|nr:DUF6596 domain-containing protein [Aeromicrobium camelliae]RQN02903.1 hypothetical protein EHW97_11830 [Aeromicrobium camelliae]
MADAERRRDALRRGESDLPEENASIDQIAGVFRAERARAVSVIAHATGGDVDLAVDAVADAFEEATRHWPDRGTPPSCRHWILETARRKAVERLRRTGADPAALAALAQGTDASADERLALIFTCCHPAQAFPAQVALTLHLVGGLTTAEIAGVFVAPEPLMAQRLERAKAPILNGAIAFAEPEQRDRQRRLDAVLAVLYLIFNEGYVGSQSTSLTDDDLSTKAIAMTRMVLELLPHEDDVRGLLALMLFIQARRAARVRPDGELVALPEQDRRLWDRVMTAEARFLLRQARRSRRRTRYTVEAQIQAEYAATIDGGTPQWDRILAHYDELRILAPSPAMELNSAVALAEVDGPEAALEAVDAVPAQSHLWFAVKTDLLERLGRPDEAADVWRTGAELAGNLTEQAYMTTRSARDASSCEDDTPPYGEDMPATPKYTVPGLSLEDGQQVAAMLQDRLNALNDLMLTLKHVHWNVVGPHFIAVHEMIDPHVVEVRDMVDETAERIATLGVAPQGTPTAIVEGRTWKGYPLDRATTTEHLKALDEVYVGLLDDHRKVQAQVAEIDPITEDMLIGQIKTMELFHWFVRAHLENQGGQLDN